MQPRVSIVIPTWDGKDLLVDCLRSLGAQTFEGFETIVVDDGSTDGTAELIERDYPGVRLVRQRENRGFCVAVNAGIRCADSPLVMLLNNDMSLERDCLERLVVAAEASDAAMFTPLVLWRDNHEIIYSAGDRILANGRPESIGFREAVDGFDFSETIFGVSAGAGLYRRALFDEVGLLDEHFVAYFEDSDLSFRARLAGLQAELVREARAYHVGSASARGRSWWRARQCYRNHALLVLKNMPFQLIARHSVAILTERFRGMGRVVSSARCEFGLAQALGILAGTWTSILGQAPRALVQRWQIQRTRVVGPRELEGLLAATGPRP